MPYQTCKATAANWLTLFWPPAIFALAEFLTVTDVFSKEHRNAR
jgi:hypothetical protein